MPQMGSMAMGSPSVTAAGATSPDRRFGMSQARYGPTRLSRGEQAPSPPGEGRGFSARPPGSGRQLAARLGAAAARLRTALAVVGLVLAALGGAAVARLGARPAEGGGHLRASTHGAGAG